jgi:glycosyltransferase involved in cell wall biosynthesis
VLPAVDQSVVSESRAWHPLFGRDDLAPGGSRPRIAVLGTDPQHRSRAEAQVLAALRTAVQQLGTVDVDVIDAPDSEPWAARLAGVDVVISGLRADGGYGTLLAMARGVAVITLPRVPDVDLVLDGVDGLVVRDTHALVNAVRGVVRDPFRLESLGQAGMERVQSAHHPEIVAELLLQHLRPGGDRLP